MGLLPEDPAPMMKKIKDKFATLFIVSPIPYLLHLLLFKVASPSINLITI